MSCPSGDEGPPPPSAAESGGVEPGGGPSGGSGFGGAGGGAAGAPCAQLGSNGVLSLGPELLADVPILFYLAMDVMVLFAASAS